MKKNNLMQNLFAMNFACATFIAFSAILASSALLTGCTGFTEDGNTSFDEGDAVDVQTAFASARVTGMGKAHVDESKDSITFVTEVFGGCIKRNGTIFYNPDYYSAKEDHLAYTFRNDTLQLSSIFEDEKTKEHITVQYIGGTSGMLDGTWRSQPCFYLDGAYYCNNEAYEKFIKIDGDNVEFRAGDVPNYDYMNSDFVGQVFRFLSNKSSIVFEDVFYSRTNNNSPEKYGITVQKKTNKSMKFTHEGRTFDLKLDFVRYSDSMAVTLSSNGTACVGYYSKKKDIPPELCREENAPYMEFNAENSDSDAHASQYKKDNRSEFEQCIKGILESEANTLSVDSGNVDVQTAFASARVMSSGKVFVDEVHDSITLVAEKFGGCVKKGESFVYDSDFYDSDTNTYAYGFQGDTLMFVQPTLIYRDGFGDSVAAVTMFFVGGTSGKLDGIWKLLPCRKHMASGDIACQNDAYDYFVKIDSGKMEFRIADLADYDYMNSIFVEELFMFLDNQNSIQIETPFYAGDVESLAKTYGIVIQEKTNKRMQFDYDGHAFDLKLNYAKIMDSVSVTLTSGNVVCNGFSREIPDITQEQCREENAPYLNEMESGVYGIRKRNDSEFEGCINGILGREGHDL